MPAGIKVTLICGDGKTVKLWVLQSMLAAQDWTCKPHVSKGYNNLFLIFFSKKRDLSSSHSVERKVKYKKGEEHWDLRTGI